ncbi:hypothetical protein ACFSFY_03355 [Sporosarcina siberiensis]|uniref:Uncharacterized protein n=1 Tax=Sporosarcina siberiensis TaxID=1365606 RepID=A0ABW4SC91_9BACL
MKSFGVPETSKTKEGHQLRTSVVGAGTIGNGITQLVHLHDHF